MAFWICVWRCLSQFQSWTILVIRRITSSVLVYIQVRCNLQWFLAYICRIFTCIIWNNTGTQLLWILYKVVSQSYSSYQNLMIFFKLMSCCKFWNYWIGVYTKFNLKKTTKFTTWPYDLQTWNIAWST